MLHGLPVRVPGPRRCWSAIGVAPTAIGDPGDGPHPAGSPETTGPASATAMASAQSGVSGHEWGPDAGSAEGTGIGRARRRAGRAAGRARRRSLRERTVVPACPGTLGLGRAAWPSRRRPGPRIAGSRWHGGGAGRPAGRLRTGRGCSRCGPAFAGLTARSSGRTWEQGLPSSHRLCRRSLRSCRISNRPRQWERRAAGSGCSMRLRCSCTMPPGGQPLMLVLDDLHAADAPSILLLRFVARDLGDARVFVLGACRDSELDRGHPLVAALAELSREPATRHLRMPGLTEADVGRLIQQTAGVVAEDSVAVAVHRYTEGNPLFVGEVVRLLAAEGRLERIDDPAGLRLAIPEGIREVIGRRVARLPEQCGRVLGLASMFGRDFSLHALEQLSGVSAGELLDILDDGIAAGMVAEVPGAPGRLRFTHALIRDALYGSIPASQRLRLHQQA